MIEKGSLLKIYYQYYLSVNAKNGSSFSSYHDYQDKKGGCCQRGSDHHPSAATLAEVIILLDPYLEVHRNVLELVQGNKIVYSPGQVPYKIGLENGGCLIFIIEILPHLEIIKLIVTGDTNRKVAERLNLTVKTVGWYRANVMSKLGIHDVTALTRFAVRHGLVEP